MIKIKYILSVFFVAFITVSIPIMVLITPEDRIIKSENRTIVPFPKINKIKKSEFIDFIDKLDKYIEDRVPFKEFVFLNFSQYYKKIVVSIDCSRAIEGKKGWLFLGNNYNNVINQHTRELPLDNKKLDYFIKNIKSISKLFSSSYTTVLICPDKHGIYSENLPNYIKTKAEFRLAEKKIKKLRANGINVIDLYSALKEEKKIRQVYYKTDTHWNLFGAEAGFRELYNQLSRKIYLNNLDFSLYDYDFISNYQGDLTRIGGYLWLKESVPVFKPLYKVDWFYNHHAISDYSHFSPNLGIPSGNYIVINRKAPNKKRVFWCGDSFSSALAPFITLSFESIHYLSRYKCDYSNHNFINIIKEFNPDLIVWETVERDL